MKAMDYANAIMATIEPSEESNQDVHEDTLMNFHRRLGHLNYDAILRLAKDPSSGLKITDDTRQNCLTCAQGKQTKNKQSQKDSGNNAPIDRIGGVTLETQKGKRYLVRNGVKVAEVYKK